MSFEGGDEDGDWEWEWAWREVLLLPWWRVERVLCSLGEEVVAREAAWAARKRSRKA